MNDNVVPFKLHIGKDGEPRVSDAEISLRLEYSDVAVFRRLVATHEKNLNQINQLLWESFGAKQGGGRKGRAFSLTEAQALFIISRSDKPVATQIMIAVSQSFVAYRRQARDEPKLLFRTFLLADEVRAWERAYPERFFVELHRVGGWKKPMGNNHSNCAHFINRYVYQHLLGDLGLHVIRESNPSNDEGVRAHKHHSMLKREHMPVLTRHIERVQDILINAVSLTHFDDAFNRTFPRPDTQTGMMFGERA